MNGWLTLLLCTLNMLVEESILTEDIYYKGFVYKAAKNSQFLHIFKIFFPKVKIHF